MTSTKTGELNGCKAVVAEWPLTAGLVAEASASDDGDALFRGTGDGFLFGGGVSVLSLGTGFF